MNNCREADEVLLSVSRDITAPYHTRPINEQEEKLKFLSSRNYNPFFVYRDPEYDTQGVEEALERMPLPNDEMGEVYDEKRRGLLLEHEIILSRGDYNKIRRLSSERYGVPDEELVEYADEILKQMAPSGKPKTVSSEDVREGLENTLDAIGLHNWTVEFSDSRTTSVYPAERRITVSKDRDFSPEELERLSVHEVGVHAVRSENGYKQPYQIFALGFPGYLPTEEGMASYFEEQTGNMDEGKMRTYAGRVIAVNSVCEGLSFRQTFDRLKNYDFTNEEAWDLSIRAHRGGGFIKDHVYLDGNKRVKEFAQEDGDFETLYVGRVGIEDLKLVRKLLNQGILESPAHIPDFVQTISQD